MNAEEEPFSYPISKIVIGNWIRIPTCPNDLLLKCSFQHKKLTWEMVGVNVEAGRGLKRKVEISWDDILSCTPKNINSDGPGSLDVDLKKLPTFLVETDPTSSKATQWEKTDEDFTWNQTASKFSKHTLHFSSGVLKEVIDKLVSADNFWKELFKIRTHLWHDDGTHMTSIAE